MGGSYHEKLNIVESEKCQSYSSRTANKIYWILVLILIILSVTMMGIYMSAFKLLLDERNESKSDDHHHHDRTKQFVKLNKTFSDKNGGHTFVVKSLAALGNNLLASSGYDSQLKIWYLITLHKFVFIISLNVNFF